MVSEFDVIPTIIGILFLVLPALALGRLCAHFKISEIVGFVFTGIALGPFAFGGMVPFLGRPLVELNDVMLSLWQISGIIILFSAGLHFTLHDLIKAGFKSAIIGFFGVASPLVLGFFISISFGYDWIVSILMGSVFSTTSIVISVTVLEEIHKERSEEGKLLVSSAVLDDVLGLAILSVVISLIMIQTIPTVESVITTTIIEIGFWFLILLGAVFVLPRIVQAVASMSSSTLEERGIKQGVALGSAFGWAAIASSAGLNPILGAFAAGMGLAGSKLSGQVREFIGRLKIIVAPLFFVVIGAHVDVTQSFTVNWVLFAGLILVAVISKILGCGLPATIFLKNWKKGLRIGFGMIARGEVAFIVSGIGLTLNVLSEELYSTVIFAILVTIFIGPILFRSSFGK